MAALHIIPLNGTQVPPKVLALIRQWAAVMYAAEMPTYGFTADGYDVYLRKMGGAIQAIVQGGMPYMLAIKIEHSTDTYKPEFTIDFTNPAPATLYLGLDTSQWAQGNGDYVFDGNLLAEEFPPNLQKSGYFYVSTHTLYYGDFWFVDMIAGKPVKLYLDKRNDCYYTAIGGKIKYYFDTRVPVIEPGYVGLSGGFSTNCLSTVTLIRFGDLPPMSDLPDSQRKISLVISYHVSYNKHVQDLALNPPLITAELWRPPKTNPKSFYPHTYSNPDAGPLSASLDRQPPAGDSRPTIDAKKTVSLVPKFTPALSKWEPHYRVGKIAQFEYDFSTGKMTLENV